MRRYLALLVLSAGGLLLTPGAAGVSDVPGDPTPPVVTPIIQGTLGLNGWYVTNVTVSWSIVDPESIILETEGCDTTTLTVDTQGITRTCRAVSDGGETTVSKTFKVDKTAPTASANPVRAADANGWYNHALTVNFTGSDVTSGLDSCSSPKTYAGPDSANATVTGSCSDVAGNTKAASFQLKYDATAPQNNGGSASRAPDSNGWYNHALTVTFSGSDVTSGIDACTEVTYSGPDDPSTSVSGSCRDLAGNQSGSSTFTLKYDETNPVVTGKSASRQPDSNGWYNHAVTVTFAGSDATSGVDTCTQTVYSGPDLSAASVPGSCRDLAGNQSGTSTFALAYDATAPQVTSTPDRLPNANGWYRASVTVTFDATDVTSGKDACDAPKTYSGPDSGNASVSGSCSDKAGNSASKSFALKYDATAPQVTSTPDRTPNANGWYRAPVTVTFDASDVTSGKDACVAPKTYSGPDSADASVTGSCSDKAGNSASKSFALKYDATAPQVTSTPDRMPNGNGWYRAPVTVTFDASDVTSGKDSCDAPKTYSGPDSGNASVSGSCSDKAGNSASKSFALKYDATAPQVTSAPDRAPNTNGWYRAPVTVTFDATDVTSGKDSCDAPKTYSGPDSANASVSGSCSDKAGNSASKSFVLKYDATAPQVTSAPDRAPNTNGWYRAAVTVTFDATDVTSGKDVCDAPKTYSGPDSTNASVSGSCSDKAGNSASKSFGLKYDATAPQVTATPSRPVDKNGWYNHLLIVTFGAADATSGVDSCDAPKTYSGPDSANASVTGSCSDKAGNSASKSFDLKYDATAPQVTSAPDRAPNTNGWYRASVTVTFDATDVTSGKDACDVPKTYSGPDSANASVTGSCSDKAGNSASKSFDLKYDATNPLVNATPDRPADANGWYNDALTVTFGATDPTSGVDSCTAPQTYSGPDTANTSVSGSCSDKAGNGASKSFGLKYDATKPVVTQVIPVRAPDRAPWYNRAVAFAVQGTDGTAGIDSCPAAVYDGPDKADAAVVGVCLDKAGNQGVKTVLVSYDARGPLVTVSPTRGADVNGWYNHPLDLTFAGSDSVSGLASCAAPERYDGPDSGSADVVGTCQDNAGNVGAGSLPLKYDSTAPQVTGAQPERAPDANGWYRRPVTIGFVGSDAVSQIAACTQASYGGPDAAQVTLSGSCRDHAGNTSGTGAFGLKYDATAPSVSGLTAKAGNRSVELSWVASTDASRVEIVRTVGTRAQKTTVYRGNGRTFTDTGLENGVRHRYEVTTYDEAENTASSSVEALPRAPLVGPANGARVAAPPLLRWAPVEGATYYNVQLWRKGRIFSAWPAGTSVRLKRSWTYDGRRYQLSPGRYRWHVWAGFGRRAAKKYGPRLGSSTFVVTRRR